MAVLVRRAAALAVGLLALSLSPAFAVFGGKPLGGADPLAKAVAAVLDPTPDGAQLCTAVALAPKLLLTAGHCTLGDRNQIRVIFSTALAGVAADRIRGVAAIARPKATAASKGMYACQNPDDIALVVLDAAAPAGTSFARLAGALPAATELRIAGYGATSDFRKADALGKHQVGFDKQLRTATMPVLSTDAALLTADQAHGSGACTGDSGGPAFDARDTGLTLIGLLVGVSSARTNNDYCRGKAYFASLPRWTGWIETTAKSLGQPLP